LDTQNTNKQFLVFQNVDKGRKRLCKEFGFTAGMLKGALAEGRIKK